MDLRTLILLLFLSPSITYALDNVTLKLDSIEQQGWSLEGVTLSLSDFSEAAQQLRAAIQYLRLPEPFDHIKLFDLQCSDFSWGNDEIHCRKGQLSIQSALWPLNAVAVSFHIGQHSSQIALNDMPVAGGRLSFFAEIKQDNWSLEAEGTGLDIKTLAKLQPDVGSTIQSGTLSFDLTSSGQSAEVKTLSLNTALERLSAQSQDGRFALENLSLNMSLKAEPGDDAWRWLNQLNLTGGALYSDPLYLDLTEKPATVAAAGFWEQAKQQILLDYLLIQQPGVAELRADARISYRNAWSIEHALLFLSTQHLDSLSAIYLSPYFAGTALEGLSMRGHLDADVVLKDQSIESVRVKSDSLGLDDTKQRLSIKKGQGTFHWTTREEAHLPSWFSWEQLTIYRLPMGPAKLIFEARTNAIELLTKTRFPLLDGYLRVDKFKWLTKENDEPDFYFEGAVRNVSLAQLSEALDWAPLSGTVSGNIPGVDYKNGKLTVNGELLIRVFDGEVRLKDLAASGFLTDFPQVYAQLEFDQLDLGQLTQTFKTGMIEGRLSGFVRDLYLENWKPVSFYAWLGTPENDDSRHRISQKAVENLTSFGGGATDIVSKTFLQLFETFSYEKLGIGCYLSDGVCQVMAMEATEQGYYIVKGGGLPRIDVMGYNPRIDWNVLLERLQRISATDDVVIE
ncbi:MAG: C4-dicarboxylate ABC transporter [Methylicorpusculum sp.]|uniref:C4-dicarboxylate ABC transporter n=1 Tax=Methylicorpusculum sp. TaxID=2713644 RepID=UPI00271A4CCD|nr:C4-dicarboxylate ABC transporter [Methylicorpusculum sp.]MDO8940194.1 C4-dicarboxylate ABC transporter [Methylicorpusculum sp.]